MKIIDMRFWLIPFICLFTPELAAQVSFQRAGEEVMPKLYSGSVMACTDLDKDGLEDLVLMDGGTHLKVFYQRGDGRGFYERDLGQQSFKPKWSMVIGDVKGDGSSDIFMCGAYDDIQWVNVSKDRIREKVILAPELYAQGANLVDINRDGYLDLFVCNDIAESYVYEFERQTDRFMRNEQWIDMETAEPSDNSGNYGSVWTDLDMNGLADLYLAKCKAGVTDPGDPRRINTLYMQVAELDFLEVGEAFGLNDGSQSWTADFADVDNDGDWDCFIANHKGPSKLMIQVAPGEFEDQSTESGLNVRFNIIQVKFTDVDNNGYVDLILSGADKGLYLNSGNSFNEIPFLDENAFTSFVTGDWNGDGKLDIYASYCDLINIPSSVADRLWWNSGGDGNFIRFFLEGTTSNRDAVGSRVELYSSLGIQMREVRAGESYGVQNSNVLHFGMSEGVLPDSVIIHWPSGLREILKDLQVNTRYHVIEGVCWYEPGEIEMDRAGYLCENDSFSLVAPPGERFMWNTGDTTSQILVKSPGAYQVAVLDAGCPMKSEPVFIRSMPDIDPDITSSNGSTLCSGGEVILSSVEGIAYLWNTGDTSREISITGPGLYNVSITGFCRDTISEDIIIDEIDTPSEPVITGDSLVLPGFGATLEASGGKILWYEDTSSVFPIGLGPLFSFDELNSDTTIYAASVQDEPGEIIAGGEDLHKGDSKLSANSLNGGIYFTVGKRCILRSVKVYTDDPGDRTFELRDPDGQVIAAKRQFLRPGESRIMLNIEVLPANRAYLLTTNADVNIDVFGHESPLLYRSDKDVQFPYSIDDEIILTKSVYGTRYYYYFYDWIIQEINGCESDRKPATVRILTSSGSYSGNKVHDGILLYPNPSQDHSFVKWDISKFGNEVQYSLFNLTGHLIFSGILTDLDGIDRIDHSLPPGIYILQIKGNGITGTVRLSVN